MHSKSNKSKSLSGNAFNKQINLLLVGLKEHKAIRDFVKEPKYEHPGYKIKQYRPDFEISLKDGSYIIIDNTTTIRSDRLKQKEFDGAGVKAYFRSFGKCALYYIVVPDFCNIGNTDTREKETQFVLTAKERIRTKQVFTHIDDIIELTQFLEMLESL